MKMLKLFVQCGAFPFNMEGVFDLSWKLVGAKYINLQNMDSYKTLNPANMCKYENDDPKVHFHEPWCQSVWWFPQHSWPLFIDRKVKCLSLNRTSIYDGSGQ